MESCGLRTKGSNRAPVPVNLKQECDPGTADREPETGLADDELGRRGRARANELHEIDPGGKAARFGFRSQLRTAAGGLGTRA
jgi:hypothetical protein